MRDSMNLRVFNDVIFNKYLKLEHVNTFSSPLLVSSLESFKNRDTLYVGQETNGWGEGNSIELENLYHSFMMNKALNTPFWQFIKYITDIDNVIWCNTLLCGKKGEIGPPIYSDEIKDISIEYLIYLYKYFNPKHVVIVSGPNDPYNEIIKEFLKEINSNIFNEYPTNKNKLIVDETKNIAYTYHPKYLNLKKSNIKDDIKELIKRK